MGPNLGSANLIQFFWGESMEIVLPLSCLLMKILLAYGSTAGLVENSYEQGKELPCCTGR